MILNARSVNLVNLGCPRVHVASDGLGGVDRLAVRVGAELINRGCSADFEINVGGCCKVVETWKLQVSRYPFHNRHILTTIPDNERIGTIHADGVGVESTERQAGK